MSSNLKLSSGPSTSGTQNRVFIRQGCNQPWTPFGCVGVTGLTSPVSNTYSHCYGADGKLESRAYKQAQDPPDVTITAGGNARAIKMFRTLSRLANSGCSPEMLLASLDCESANDVKKPVKGDMFVKVRLGPGQYQFGNNTFRSLDATQTARYEEQATLAQLALVEFGRPSIEKFSAFDTEDEILSLAVCDDGHCADGACVECGDMGCTKIAAVTWDGASDFAWMWNKSGGAEAWSELSSVTVGHTPNIDSRVACIGGRVFFTGESISVGVVDPITGMPAITEAVFLGANGVPFTPSNPQFSNAVLLSDGNIGVAGYQNSYYVSRDGLNFVRVTAESGGSYSAVAQCVAENGNIYLLTRKEAIIVGPHTRGDYQIMVSEDNGRSWSQIGTGDLAYTALFEEGEAQDIWCAGNEAHVVINGHHFVTSCGVTATAGKTYKLVNLSGAPTNVGSCDASCDEMFSITVGDGTATIRWTVDGFSGSDGTDVIATVAGASSTRNPIACCDSQQGVQSIIAIGKSLYVARTWEPAFASELVGV